MYPGASSSPHAATSRAGTPRPTATRAKAAAMQCRMTTGSLQRNVSLQCNAMQYLHCNWLHTRAMLHWLAAMPCNLYSRALLLE